ncbi:T9SS type A sorting domain-containing protein [Saprospiraceae bacterium]|nr:T9SS type A sorting domain-containing protein [Saprospiraceae bacterium]
MKLFLTLFFTVLTILSNSLIGQSLNWEQINGDLSPRIEGKLNGLNMGGYTYGAISQQGSEVSILDECVQCVDFDCSPFLSRAMITGKQYNSTAPKELFVQKSKELKPAVLRFPGGTHSGWYHFYQYDDNGFYDAANPTIAKGYGMNIGETIHLPNPYSYCQEDTKLTIDSNYIQSFANYVLELKKDQPADYKLSISYVANILTHFQFPIVNLPLIGSCTSTCGRTLSLQPMSNYNCQESFDLSYEGNEELFDNNPAIYRFELSYKETQDAIEFLANRLNLEQDDILYVELGNEYYNNDGLTSGYSFEKYGMSAMRYAQLAEIYSERLKCYFENRLTIKTAIVSKPNSNWQSTTNIFKPNYPGIANLMDADQNNDGQTLNDVIDAVILHDYYTSNECSNIYNIDERFNCARESFSEHLYGENGLVNDLDNFKINFPGKSIWLTEWNIVGGDQSNNVDFINTALHASFVQEYMLKLFAYNSLNDNIIELAHHHRIGFDLPWSVIQVQDGENDVAIERASASPIKYLSEIQGAESIYYHGNIIQENGEVYDEARVTVNALSREGQNENEQILFLYYTNKSDDVLNFSFPSEINNMEIISAINSHINGESLFSYGPSNGTHGRNRFRSENGNLYDEELNALGFGELHNSLQKIEAQEINISESFALQANSTGIYKILLKLPIGTAQTILNSNQVKLTPNPFDDYVSIDIRSNVEIRAVEIFNQNGQSVSIITEDLTNKRFQISHLNPGIYWYKITTNKGVVYKKGIKI